MTPKNLSLISLISLGLSLIALVLSLSSLGQEISNASTETTQPPKTVLPNEDYGTAGKCTTATPTTTKGKYSYETHRTSNKVSCYNTKNWSDWQGDDGGHGHNMNNPGHDDSKRG